MNHESSKKFPNFFFPFTVICIMIAIIVFIIYAMLTFTSMLRFSDNRTTTDHVPSIVNVTLPESVGLVLFFITNYLQIFN